MTGRPASRSDSLRLAVHRTELFDDARDPKRAFGFFTVVAAISVVGIRRYSTEAPLARIVLAVLSVRLRGIGVMLYIMLAPWHPAAADRA